MTDKQYPELPEPTAWRTYDNLLKRARYNAMPITSMQPGIYSHTRMFTEDQMRAFADATCAMRANNMFLKERAKLNQEWGAINGIRAAQASPFGYVNTYTGQFFKDVEPSRKNNEGHWVTVYAEPQAAPASQDALHAAKHCLEMGESFRALRRVVNLLLDARRNLGPEDHELRDRIDRLLRDDAARAAQGGTKA